MDNIRFPFGPATVVDPATATGAVAVTIENGGLTVVDLATTEASGNRTLNLTLPSPLDGNLPIGAELLLKVKSAATQTLTMGTGIDGATITGVAGKTFTQLFKFDGTVFVPAGTANQID
jgi:hypothetical protein